MGRGDGERGSEKERERGAIVKVVRGEGGETAGRARICQQGEGPRRQLTRVDGKEGEGVALRGQEEGEEEEGGGATGGRRGQREGRNEGRRWGEEGEGEGSDPGEGSERGG